MSRVGLAKGGFLGPLSRAMLRRKSASKINGDGVPARRAPAVGWSGAQLFGAQVG